MKVLVTGSAGRLGSAVMAKLRSSKIEAIGADLISGPTTDLVLDIRDAVEVVKACQNMDAIIHTAALHGKHYDLDYSREQFIHTNVYGTLNLLNAAVKCGVKKLLYISTTSIYGNAMVDAAQAVWVDELLSEQPRDIYDITKQTAEQLCKDFFYKEQLETSVYRVGRFLPEAANLQANHRLYRGLDPRDGAEALYLALQQNFTDFEIFNIASSSPFTRDDLKTLKSNPVEIIQQMYPDAVAIYEAKQWQLPNSIDRVYVTDKANRLLSYSPKFTFDYLLRNKC